MATSGYERYRCGITLKLRLCARRNSFRIADNLPGMTRSAPFRIGTVISGNRQVKSSHGSLLAKYRYRSRRFSLVKVCTQDRNRCSPSKLILPSAAINSSFLFPRA